MIDTIVLTLTEGFTIVEHDRFTPSTRGLFEPPYYALGGRGTMRCTQNPANQKYKGSAYRPRLTATKRIAKGGFEVSLRIEFSAPKLLFENNFDELNDGQFDLLLSMLNMRLKEMGVDTTIHILRDAPVSVVHYSKNIVLTDHSTPHGIIQELSKANYSQRLDTNRTDFRNEGHGFKLRTNTFEIAFYDKLKDLRQAKLSEKRAIETDNAIQLNLLDGFKPKKPFEVLRMEVRLNTRAKIRQMIRQLELQIEPTLSALFSAEVSNKILNKVWAEVEIAHKLLAYKPEGASELLAELLARNPMLSARKAIQIVGLKLLIEEGGLRALRIEIERGSGRRTWYRLIKEAESLNWPHSRYGAFGPIRQALKNFRPVQLADY